MGSSEEKKFGDELGTPGVSPEDVATIITVHGRRARRKIARRKKAEQCAAKIDVVKAVAAASLAERKAREAARIAKAKAEEAEEAWKTAKAKAEEAEEAARIAELVVNFRYGCILVDAYPSRLSTLEFKYDIIMHSVEATICIKVTIGSWPDGFRGVFSAFTTSAADLKVKLLDFGDDELPVDAGGMIKLSRNVVFVGLEERLKVLAMACPMEEEQVCESTEVSFKPAETGISPSGVELKVGSCSMEVSVSWSASLLRQRRGAIPKVVAGFSVSTCSLCHATNFVGLRYYCG
jgi:hypothetical protein